MASRDVRFSRATNTTPDTAGSSGIESLTVSSGVESISTRSQRSASSDKTSCIRREPSSSEGFGGDGPAGSTRRDPRRPFDPRCTSRASSTDSSPISTAPKPWRGGIPSRSATAGRRRSASTTMTSLPARASARASCTETVVFPSSLPGLVMSTLDRRRSTLKYVSDDRSVTNDSITFPEDDVDAVNASTGTAPSNGSPAASATSSACLTRRSLCSASATAPSPNSRATINARITLRVTRGAIGAEDGAAASTTVAYALCAARSARKRASSIAS